MKLFTKLICFFKGHDVPDVPTPSFSKLGEWETIEGEVHCRRCNARHSYKVIGKAVGNGGAIYQVDEPVLIES